MEQKGVDLIRGMVSDRLQGLRDLRNATPPEDEVERDLCLVQIENMTWFLGLMKMVESRESKKNE